MWLVVVSSRFDPEQGQKGQLPRAHVKKKMAYNYEKMAYYCQKKGLGKKLTRDKHIYFSFCSRLLSSAPSSPNL